MIPIPKIYGAAGLAHPARDSVTGLTLDAYKLVNWARDAEFTLNQVTGTLPATAVQINALDKRIMMLEATLAAMDDFFEFIKGVHPGTLEEYKLNRKAVQRIAP